MKIILIVAIIALGLTQSVKSTKTTAPIALTPEQQKNLTLIAELLFAVTMAANNTQLVNLTNAIITANNITVAPSTNTSTPAAGASAPVANSSTNNTVVNVTQPGSVAPASPTNTSSPAPVANSTTNNNTVVTVTLPGTDAPTPAPASSTNTSSPADGASAPVTNSSTVPAKDKPATNITAASNDTNTTQPASNTTTPVVSPTNSTAVVNSSAATNITTPVVNTWVSEPTIKHAKNDVNPATFAQQCLETHNYYRGLLNLSNLTWSDSLATTAQAWSDNMAVNGFRHSGGPYGENIASTTYSTHVTYRLLETWWQEKSHFIVGCKYPHCSSNSAEVGHYTQMVWAKTTQVGCGFSPGTARMWNYLTCQYLRAGNVIGQYVYPVATA